MSEVKAPERLELWICGECNHVSLAAEAIWHADGCVTRKPELFEYVPATGSPDREPDVWDASNAVLLCDKCKNEHGEGIADKGDRACSVCGSHDAPHVYPPLYRNPPDRSNALTEALDAARRVADLLGGDSGNWRFDGKKLSDEAADALLSLTGYLNDVEYLAAALAGRGSQQHGIRPPRRPRRLQPELVTGGARVSEVKAPERLRVRISDTGEPMGLAGPAATDGEASSVVEYVPATDSPDRERWLDRLIEVWHDEVLRDRAAEMELHEFLGVTWEEYAAWVEERADLHPPDRSDGLREALETLSDAVSEARWGTNLLSDQQTITISRIHFDRINAALAAARLALKAESK